MLLQEKSTETELGKELNAERRIWKVQGAPLSVRRAVRKRPEGNSSLTHGKLEG